MTPNIARLARRSLLGALLALATGCTPTFSAPPGFVELDPAGSHDFRAVTADGLVIAGREIDNDPGGDLAFWTRAVEHQMRFRGGYALLEKRPVKNRAGEAGIELRFEHDEGKTPHLYYVALFVKGDWIYVVEAGGTRELVQKGERQIAWATENVRMDCSSLPRLFRCL